MRGRADYTIPLDDATELYDKATLRAIEKLENKGLSMNPRPLLEDGGYYDGHLPADLNSFTNRQLGQIHSLQCQFTDWVHGEFAIAKAEASNAEQKLKQARAHVRKSKKGTAQEKEDLTLIDERYVQANALYMECAAYAKLVEIRSEAASRDLRVISRLITVKEGEIQMNQRDINISRRRNGGNPRRF